jgi:hypothetical protein
VAPAMGVVIDPVGRVLSIRVVRTFDAPAVDPSLASAQVVQPVGEQARVEAR